MTRTRRPCRFLCRELTGALLALAATVAWAAPDSPPPRITVLLTMPFSPGGSIHIRLYHRLRSCLVSAPAGTPVRVEAAVSPMVTGRDLALVDLRLSQRPGVRSAQRLAIQRKIAHWARTQSIDTRGTVQRRRSLAMLERTLDRRPEGWRSIVYLVAPLRRLAPPADVALGHAELDDVVLEWIDSGSEVTNDPQARIDHGAQWRRFTEHRGIRWQPSHADTCARRPDGVAPG